MEKINPPETFSDVIRLWPSRFALARDIGEEPGTVQKWYQRNSLPPGHWNKVIEAAKVRGLVQVTLERLSTIADNRKD